jgi:tRNA (guanine37-N1)-methyltransferase
MVDRSLFVQSQIIQALRVPVSVVGSLLKTQGFSDSLLALRGRRSIVPCPLDPKSHRLILLRDTPHAHLLNSNDISVVEYELKTTYDEYNTEEVLRKLIPMEQDPPTSFETIGHIAHMNLRDEFLQYKNLIGEVILDKNAHIRTVVTKTGVLSNEFRTFPMEIIASRGNDDSLVATVNEQKMKLRVDYKNCYWNSRLATERERLMKAFLSTGPEESRLIDMCCGIGALACFASRQGIEVYANDLNPSAIDCAKLNAFQNRVDVEFSNMDAREFVRTLVHEGRLRDKKINHVMINLPEIGVEFIDVFHGLFETEKDLNGNEFRIYCHIFSRENSPKDILERIPLDLPENVELKIIHVRDVAPNKIMYSAEFKVPNEILIKNSNKKSRLE